MKEVKPLYTEYALGNVSDDQVKMFLSQKWINVDVEKTLRKIVAHKGVVANLDLELKSEKSAFDQIFVDQGRLRENMKALKGSVEEKALLQRYTRQLDEEENQIAGLRKKLKETLAQKDQANEKLAKMIGELELDQAL